LIHIQQGACQIDKKDQNAQYAEKANKKGLIEIFRLNERAVSGEKISYPVEKLHIDGAPFFYNVKLMDFLYKFQGYVNFVVMLKIKITLI